MARELYLLLIQGTEATIEGPFVSENQRLQRAQKFWKSEAKTERGDNVFQLTWKNGKPSIGSYISGSLEDTVDEKESKDP